LIIPKLCKKFHKKIIDKKKRGKAAPDFEKMDKLWTNVALFN